MKFTISNLPEMNIFREKENYIARDILKVGYNVFNLEKELKKKKQLEDKYKLSLTLPTFVTRDNKRIGEIISKLFKSILNVNVNVAITTANYKFKSARNKTTNIENKDTICLFSGGVDSFFGIFEANNKYKNMIGVSIAHSDQSGMINIVKKIIFSILEPRDINVRLVYAPGITATGYSQFRGFLYILCAGAYSDIVKAKRILVTECGTTMYQPKFSPFDSVTSTTHPLILGSSKEIIEIIRNTNIEIITPFEDMTKAEIISFSPENKYLPQTHSCISARYRTNCGVCYGCVLRKLGAIVSNVKDCVYDVDVISDNEANIDNLLSLLRFSYFFLFHRDKLGDYSLDKILKYKKEDLFERQSLEVLSALYVLKQNKVKFSKAIESAYQVYVEPVDKKILEKRIKDIRNKTKKPDFNKKVK